jgi:hypothetical protein
MGASVPCPAAKNSQTEASRTTAPTRVVSAAKQAERDKAGPAELAAGMKKTERHVTGDRPWEKNDEEDRARREERLHGGSSIAQV